jgi:hypothetical protein
LNHHLVTLKVGGKHMRKTFQTCTFSTELLFISATFAVNNTKYFPDDFLAVTNVNKVMK